MGIAWQHYVDILMRMICSLTDALKLFMNDHHFNPQPQSLAVREIHKSVKPELLSTARLMEMAPECSARRHQ
jgi:hypothetical protein